MIYSQPLPDQRADLLAALQADKAKADALATERWLAEPTWPELHDHAEPGAAPKDCRP